MAIHFIAGRPGAGKGLYSLDQIVRELRFTNRKIVTNFALLPDILGEYLNEKYKCSFDLLHRLQLLDDEAIRAFYTWRGADVALAVANDKQGRPETFDISGAQASGGVFYLLDEVHLAFGARDWQTMGKAVMYYASQHRKLGDDVLLVTQAPKNVDSQFRSLAQDYTVLRNHSLEKVGIFKQPSIFSKSVYLNLPTGNEQAMEHTVFRLDKKLAACYDTSKGVGIQRRGEADIGKDRRKGISWIWLVVAVVLGCFALWQIPRFAFGKVKDSFVKPSGGLVKGVSGTNSATTNSAPALTNAVPALPPPRPAGHTNKVVSMLRNGSGIIFILDNGREVSDRRHNLKLISNEQITDSDGVSFPLPFVLD